jgi:hypothetical protein
VIVKVGWDFNKNHNLPYLKLWKLYCMKG